MANAVLSKFMNMFGMGAEDEEQEEDYEDINEQYEEDDDEPKGLFGRRNNKVVNMAQQVRMVIMQPTGFEQSEEICDLLKEKKSIIINLEYVNKDVARRIIDVVSGAAHALDGHMQKISSSIFLVAPYNYDITSDSKEETKSKIPVFWLKSNSNN